MKDAATNLRFGFLVHDVSRLRRVIIDRTLKPVGITRSQWWLLSFLGRRDGMTQSALAADLDLTRVAIGGLLDRMEKSGFVERRPDPRDARLKRVYLRPAGQKFLQKIAVEIEAVEQEITSDLDDDTMQLTAEALIRMKRRLLTMVDAEDDVDTAEIGSLAS